MNSALLNKMRQHVDSNTALELTIEKAIALRGKRIATIYFGYNGQYGVDEFVVGDIVSKYDIAKSQRYNEEKTFAEHWDSYMTKQQLDEVKNTMVLLREDGTDTSIYSHKINNGAFTCSDSDRFVYFVEL